MAGNSGDTLTHHKRVIGSSLAVQSCPGLCCDVLRPKRAEDCLRMPKATSSAGGRRLLQPNHGCGAQALTFLHTF